MNTTKTVTFNKDSVIIMRVGDDVYVKSYPYTKITEASKSRLENLQFSCKSGMLTLFELDWKSVFSVLHWS